MNDLLIGILLLISTLLIVFAVIVLVVWSQEDRAMYKREKDQQSFERGSDKNDIRIW